MLLLYICLAILFMRHIKTNINSIEKDKFQNIILTVIEKKEVDLNILKSISTNPNNYIDKKMSTILYSFIFIDDTQYYEKPIILKNVLIELRDKEYIKSNSNQKTIGKLENYIKELSKVSLIDRLLINQKDHFYNIKDKLSDEKYTLIKLDIEKIIEELDLKNKLTDKYLANSDLSYNISILSLILSIIGVFSAITKVFNFLKERFSSKKSKD